MVLLVISGLSNVDEFKQEPAPRMELQFSHLDDFEQFTLPLLALAFSSLELV